MQCCLVLLVSERKTQTLAKYRYTSNFVTSNKAAHNFYYKSLLDIKIMSIGTEWNGQLGNSGGMEWTCIFPEISTVLLERIMFQLNSMYLSDGSVTIGKIYVSRLYMSRRRVWCINYCKNPCHVNAAPSHSEYSRFWSGAGFIKFVIVNCQMGRQGWH